MGHLSGGASSTLTAPAACLSSIAALEASCRSGRGIPQVDLLPDLLARSLWDREAIAEATRLLARAARQQHPGPLKGAQTRSCSMSVLMEEAAEQVASVYNALVILVQNGQLGRRVWRLHG
jgi:predicted RNA polymerase sigma factor